jgi:hypothetical protein
MVDNKLEGKMRKEFILSLISRLKERDKNKIKRKIWIQRKIKIKKQEKIKLPSI